MRCPIYKCSDSSIIASELKEDIIQNLEDDLSTEEDDIFLRLKT